jgi:hypothetical protein
MRMAAAFVGLPSTLRFDAMSRRGKAGDFRGFPMISSSRVKYHIRFGIKIEGITQITRFADELLKTSDSIQRLYKNSDNSANLKLEVIHSYSRDNNCPKADVQCHSLSTSIESRALGETPYSAVGLVC